MTHLDRQRVTKLLRNGRKTRILVVGDVMLDHFIWGRVSRISPEAPVPVVEFERESWIPGGAANVARNLTALGVRTEMLAVRGADDAGARLKGLLESENVDCTGVIAVQGRSTSIKTRIIAHQQQVVRVDREKIEHLHGSTNRRLADEVVRRLPGASALIVGDYGKGAVSQPFLDELRRECRLRGVWLSVDPKPVHSMDLAGLSLITPNRKEAFELGREPDGGQGMDPLADPHLLRAADRLMQTLAPALLLITLGDQGMLLCQRGQKHFHIPTAAREVFDVSGAGDTVIAAFTTAIAAGASPIEAAEFSNQAAGIVVGKVGTAVATPDEILDCFN